ncbi:hypothetical protein D3C71_1755590 [compost metagenome]
MQVSSSIMIIPPEPIIEPRLVSVSKSMVQSRCSSVRQPPDGPPVCTALNFLPPGIPPPISKITSRRVMPIGTSTSPVFTTLPPSANTLVPFDFSVPILAYHSAPFRIIWAILASVSTLLMIVGCPHNPSTAGKGGLGVGIPRWPSME